MPFVLSFLLPRRLYAPETRPIYFTGSDPVYLTMVYLTTSSSKEQTKNSMGVGLLPRIIHMSNAVWHALSNAGIRQLHAIYSTTSGDLMSPIMGW